MEIHHEVNSLRLTLKNRTFDSGKTALHWHEKLEFVQALDKPFNILIEGVWYEVCPGDVVLIGERVIHLFDIKENNTSVRIGQFPLGALLGVGIKPIPIKPIIKKNEIECDPDFSFRVHGIINTISREQQVTSEENPFLQMMLSALYFLLMSRFGISEDATSKKGKREFYRVIEYVKNHYRENITVGSIASELYMDRGRLSSLFLKYSGVSLPSYINTLRIAAAEVLLDAGRSVTDAALESGFQSVRTFNDVYKRYAGKPPSQAKKSN